MGSVDRAGRSAHGKLPARCPRKPRRCIRCHRDRFWKLRVPTPHSWPRARRFSLPGGHPVFRSRRRVGPGGIDRLSDRLVRERRGQSDTTRTSRCTGGSPHRGVYWTPGRARYHTSLRPRRGYGSVRSRNHAMIQSALERSSTDARSITRRLGAPNAEPSWQFRPEAEENV
jgi:hypothetical protein